MNAGSLNFSFELKLNGLMRAGPSHLVREFKYFSLLLYKNVIQAVQLSQSRNCTHKFHCLNLMWGKSCNRHES